MFCLSVFCFLYLVIFGLVGSKPVNENGDRYKIGFGISDITGPASDINMMGYAKIGQNTRGIHTRLFSRAMIIEDSSGKRVCYVNLELCAATQIVKLLVIQKLKSVFGSKLYTHENTILSATHTHSGPGGYFQYLLFVITQEGFIKSTTSAIVSGIVKSIVQAHKNLRYGYIHYTEGMLFDASINRSPASYLQNPEEERANYEHDTDKLMQLLKFTDEKGNPIGMANWFPVHLVSMNNSNKLISSDNKGYAAIKFEQDFNGYSNIGMGPFVSIFGQSNEGDSSSNTKGPHCLDTGLPCDFVHSTCNGRNELCVAFGPGKDMFESTKIIGEKQYRKARELFEKADEPVKGGINYIAENINMTKREFTLENGTKVETCVAALGYSFAAGTIDGEGESSFKQGTTLGKESLLWDFLRDVLISPSKETKKCHEPKAVFLSVGELKFPYRWTPEIVTTQIVEVGNIVIVALPGEFTTMSGRRIRNDVQRIYTKNNRTNVHVILAGLANTYTNYIATYEEYQLQRYEGGSTLFGPYTLDAYREQYRKLAGKIIKGQKIFPTIPLPNLLSKAITLKPGVFYDMPLTHRFGDVILDASDSYVVGSRVEVRFCAASPRNNVKLGGTFLTVEKYESRKWNVVATDAHWETMFIWNRNNTFLGTSEVTIIWDIPLDTKPGTYRIRYFGDRKNIWQRIEEFFGTTRSFQVLQL